MRLAVKVVEMKSYGVSLVYTRHYPLGELLLMEKSLANDLTTVAFKVYDIDRDGYISNGELYLVLKQMVGNNLKVGSSLGFHVESLYVDSNQRLFTGKQDQQLQQIVDKTIMEADKDG